MTSKRVPEGQVIDPKEAENIVRLNEKLARTEELTRRINRNAEGTAAAFAKTLARQMGMPSSVGPSMPGEGGGPGGGGSGGAGSTAGRSGHKAPPKNHDRQWRDPRQGMGYRAAQGAGNFGQSAASSFTSGRNDPAWALRSTAKTLDEVLGVVTDGMVTMSQSIDQISGSLPGVDLAIGGVITGIKMTAVSAAIASKIYGEAVEARYEETLKLQRFERPAESYRATTGYHLLPGSTKMREGARWGFTPQESAETLSQFVRTIGHQDARDVQTPFQAIASGINPEMLGRLIGTGAPGGGARGGIGAANRAAHFAIGTGQKMGLRGNKLNEMLGRITSHVESMAERGVSMDLDSVLRSASGLQTAGKYSAGTGNPNDNPFGGMQGVRATQKLSNMGAGAAQSFAGNFGNMGNMAIQAWAFSKTGDPLKAMELMEEAQANPEIARQATVRMLGKRAGAMAFMGAGFSSKQSRILSSTTGTLHGPIEASRGNADQSGFPIGRALAEQELNRLAWTQNEGLGPEMVRLTGMVHDALVKLSSDLNGLYDLASVIEGRNI